MFSRRCAALAVLLLGCGREAAPGPAPRELAQAPVAQPPAPPPGPVPTAITSAATSATASAAPPAPPARRFVMVELAPTQGDLAPLLRDISARAKEKGLRPVVEFYADWCAPCRVFQENLADPDIAAALAGTFLVRLNLDDWHDKLRGTNIKVVKTIPSFYLLGDDGRPNGKMLDGDKWGKSTPARMGAALKAFLEG
jgi:thiol-disulfide isomerase/thioredoxin